ncbi:MAG TPA: response regulator [Gemmataceae bacterium]|nr:response regulator [Gemmataceae bacterium]
MKILIADADQHSRLAAEALLVKQGHDVVVTESGAAAWQALQAVELPKIAILDWTMQDVSGVELCRRVRAAANLKAVYLILLTSQPGKKHLLDGLAAGANDYIAKPLDHDEFEARVYVGAQMVQLQFELAQRVTELEDALTKVQQLQGLLPICSYCKSIRDDQDYWHRVENYIGAHSGAQFSHGICPECWKKVVEPELEKMGVPLPHRQS